MEPLLSSSRAGPAGAFDVVVVQRAHQDGQLQAQRYDFQHPAVLKNVPPPTVQFSHPLRWWSLDRRRRLAAAMRLRDRLIEDIMRARDRKPA